MMGIVLVMTLHACYVACKQSVDNALPPPVAKSIVSRVPIVPPNAKNTRHVDIHIPIEMDIRNQITPPTWVDNPFKCRDTLKN